MKSCTDAARAVTLYAALQLDLADHSLDDHVRRVARARDELLIAVIKGWSTELGVQLTSLGIQIHGGMGTSKRQARRSSSGTRASRPFAREQQAFRRPI
jgi:alkylation response protein AidB-like acyl-CoA dehydrogenase